MVTDEKHTTGTETVTLEHHNHNHKNKKTYGYGGAAPRRTISATILLILLLVGITALVLWFIYRPQNNPKFTVVAVTVYAAVNSITTVQFTVITRNPNNRASIYYDHLAAFLTYRNQPITPQLMLPPLHHETDSTVVMTPIWPLDVNGLLFQTSDEVVSLRLVLTGSLRWKAGNIMKTGRKRVYVGCDVLVGLKRGVLGQVPLVGSSVCDVDI